MSRSIAGLVAGFARLATCCLSHRQRDRVYARVRDHFARAATGTVETRHGDLAFYTHRGAAAASAVHTFQGDEPETIAWIDDCVKPGEVVWDIGANIGLYACYAARAGARVVAIEPSGLNFGLLVEHIELNGLGDAIDAYCIGLSDATTATDLFASGFEEGHSFSTVGRPESQFSTFEPRFRQAILAFTADELVARFDVPPPDHIKLDVDGIEIEILKGASGALANAQTLIMEIQGRNRVQFDARIRPLLDAAGLVHAGDWMEESRNQLFKRA